MTMEDQLAASLHQSRATANARRADRPETNILNEDEEARIHELIVAGTWPQGWDGDGPVAASPMDQIFRDGSVQPLLV